MADDLMPPKLATAIAAVMAGVPKLAKEDKNIHGGYKFASIDDFLEAVRPLCAKHGVVIVQHEAEFSTVEAEGKDRKKTWLSMKFEFILAHSSGETWAFRPVRSIMVDAAMGAQAFGAGQSYALKQFLRSLFQIATGDEDADSHPPADLPERARRVLANRPPQSNAGVWAEQQRQVIAGYRTREEITAWVEANNQLLSKLAEKDAKVHDDLMAYIDRMFEEIPRAKEIT